MTESIVLRTLLGVSQHTVSFGRLLEVFLSFFVPEILVRMVPERKLSIGTLEPLWVGSPLDPKNIVVISF